MDNQQGPTARTQGTQCYVPAWLGEQTGRMDIMCTRRAKALHCSQETTITLELQYQIKCLKLKKNYSSTSLRFKPNTIGIDVNSMTPAFG